MFPRLLLAGFLLTFTAATVTAAPSGLNMAWTGTPGLMDNCPSNPLNQVDAVDACSATDAPKHFLVCSVVAPPGCVAVDGESVDIEMVAAAPVLDDYWHLEQGGCRFGSLPSVSNDFNQFDQTTCVDFWTPNENQGGFQWTSNVPGPNRARLRAVFAVPPAAAAPMTSGTEYYLIWALILGGNKPNGQNVTCTDCHDPACFVFSSLTLSQLAGVGDIRIFETPSTRAFVTWQGGANTNCPGATAVRKSTWGELKSLYRD